MHLSFHSCASCFQWERSTSPVVWQTQLFLGANFSSAASSTTSSTYSFAADSSSVRARFCSSSLLFWSYLLFLIYFLLASLCSGVLYRFTIFNGVFSLNYTFKRAISVFSPHTYLIRDSMDRYLPTRMVFYLVLFFLDFPFTLLRYLDSFFPDWSTVDLVPCRTGMNNLWGG